MLSRSSTRSAEAAGTGGDHDGRVSGSASAVATATSATNIRMRYASTFTPFRKGIRPVIHGGYLQ